MHIARYISDDELHEWTYIISLCIMIKYLTSLRNCCKYYLKTYIHNCSENVGDNEREGKIQTCSYIRPAVCLCYGPDGVKSWTFCQNELVKIKMSSSLLFLLTQCVCCLDTQDYDKTILETMFSLLKGCLLFLHVTFTGYI